MVQNCVQDSFDAALHVGCIIYMCVFICVTTLLCMSCLAVCLFVMSCLAIGLSVLSPSVVVVCCVFMLKMMMMPGPLIFLTCAAVNERGGESTSF